MNTHYSSPLKSAGLVIVLLLVGLGCNYSSATVNHDGTAQALQATEQALDAKLTQAAVESTATQSATQTATTDSQTATQTATATSNVNIQATTTALALHVLQTANAQNKQATAAAHAAQSPQQSSSNSVATVSFEVINESAYTLCQIYFSSPLSDEWMQQDAIAINIPPDYQQSFNIQPDKYDLRVEDCSGYSVEEYYNIDIPEYDTWYVTGETSRSDEPLCGDGYCGDFEHAGNCPQDCGSDDGPLCGDGYCGDFENSGNCPQDCGSTSSVCGDAYCEWDEDMYSCSAD